MKCKKCGERAIINMRQHNMGLCKDDFLTWIPEQSERFIQKYAMFSREEKVLVAVSGGKDSLGLWDILWRLGYQVDGLYIALGIDEGIDYSGRSLKLSQKFADQRGLHLQVVDLEREYGSSVPVLSETTRRGKGRPCSVCGLVKRHEMNRIARDMGYDVLATGHNLDDEAAVLFGNTINWMGEYLIRQDPVLPESNGLARKVKPLFRFYEKEMAVYALLREIEYMHDECPHAAGSKTIYYKELLNQLENRRPGAKLAFFVKFLDAKKKGLFARQMEEVQSAFETCPSCGQLTSAPGLCSFCRMIQKATPGT